MSEIAVLTGDIINSKAYQAGEWMNRLKPFLQSFGTSPGDWEIYRGDEFQLRLSPQQALKAAIQLKALIKQVKGLDVRMAIGIGQETYRGARVGESNGTAYQRSGKAFESLKQESRNMCLATGRQAADRALNLMIALALDFMDDWSPVSAEMMFLVLEKPNASQDAMARHLHIRQSAVSQRLKRARYDLVLALLTYYSLTINNTAP